MKSVTSKKQRQRDTRRKQDFTIPPYYELDSFLRASLTQSPVNSQATQYNLVSLDSFASQTASRTRPWLSRNGREYRLSGRNRATVKSDRLTLPCRKNGHGVLSHGGSNRRSNNSTSANDGRDDKRNLSRPGATPTLPHGFTIYGRNG